MRALARTLAIFLFASLAGTAWADEISDILGQIYKPYLEPGAGFTPVEDNPHLSSGLKALFDGYFARQSDDEVGMLDFDPFISAQDYVLKDFSIKSEAIDGDKATVVVEFMNFDYWTELTYSFVRENADWRIADIKSNNPDSWVLSRILSGE